MTNLEKYNHIFEDIFPDNTIELSQLTYQSIEEWDSIGHMGLITSLEDEFDIMFETDDIINFSSYQKGIELLKKYNIHIEND